jgi:replicative DNA helicase
MKNVYGPQDAVHLAREQVLEYQNSPNPGLKTGIPGIDELLYPLRSNVAIIHALTNHGKSVLLDNIVENNLPSPEEPDEVIVKVLLEDSIEEQAIRESSMQSDPFLSVSDITSGKMTKEQMKNFDRALLNLAQKPVWRIGNSQQDHRERTLTTAPMMFDAIKWIAEKQGKKIRAVAIDYFQRIALPEGTREHRQGYKEQVDILDSMAQGFGCPVIVAAQSGREADKQRRMPQKNEIQETSRLEQAARCVMVSYRPHDHFGIGSEWTFLNHTITINDDKLVVIGIQKQKYEKWPVYRLFRTTENMGLVQVDIKTLDVSNI